MKRIPTTLKFLLGYFVIVVVSFIQVAYPWFPGTLIIFPAVVFCIWQFRRKVQEMKNSIAQEKSMRVAADRYIHTRIPKG